MRVVVAWIATAIVFVGLDAIWLTQVAPRLAPPRIGELLANTVRPVPAIAFYLIYLTGIVVLAVLPVEQGSAQRVLTRGAILGFVAYATYDLTNQATMRVWSTTITLADLAWGTTITAVAALAGYIAASRIR
ncbi:MAG: DUF2177 family protein [Vitreimonas sp.]